MTPQKGAVVRLPPYLLFFLEAAVYIIDLIHDDFDE